MRVPRSIIALVALAALAMACGKPSVERLHQPIDIIALDAGGALVIGATSIVALDSGAQPLWHHELAGAVVPGEIVVGPGHVFVRYVGRDGLAHGLAVKLDGRVAWDVVLAHTPASRSASSLAYRPVVVGPVVVWMLRDDDPSLVAVDTQRGVVAWRAAVDAQTSATVLGAHLLERRPGKPATWRDPATGTAHLGPATSEGCVRGAAYLTVDGHRLTFHEGPSARRELAIPRILMDEESMLLVGCGTYRDQHVLVVKHAGRDDDLHLVLVLAADGRVVRSIELPASTVEASALGADLPRFVLLRADTRYVMVDLDAGRVAWQQPAGATLGGRVVRSGMQWYATDGYNLLAAFAGATGHLVHAIAIGPPDTDTAQGSLLVEIDPAQFRRGVGWMATRTARPLSQLEVLLLAEPTLAPRFQRGQWTVTDATAHVIQVLDLR